MPDLSQLTVAIIGPEDAGVIPGELRDEDVAILPSSQLLGLLARLKKAEERPTTNDALREALVVIGEGILPRSDMIKRARRALATEEGE